MLWNGVLATTIATLLVTAAPAAADTFTVTSPEDVAGRARGTACASIRQALDARPQPGRGHDRRPPGHDQLSLGALRSRSDVTLAARERAHDDRRRHRESRASSRSTTCERYRSAT